MDKKTIRKLNNVNKKFYKNIFTDFNDSRGYFWEGWDRLLEILPKIRPLKVLDIGCGNGRFYEFLVSKGVEISYLGLDNSKELLDIARYKYPNAEFQELDIIEQSLDTFVNYDLVASFGVFHHIPSLELRKKIFGGLVHCLSADCILAVSFWQFTKSENLMKRVLDWDSIGITTKQIEKGDYLLDWKRGNCGSRYCHLVDETEVKALLRTTKIKEIKEVETYYADGKSGDLNLYLVAKK